MQKPVFKKEKLIEEIIRVDHAGEYGAKRIYAGQLEKISSKDDKAKIQLMYEQELVHLKYFENIVHSRKIRPTILMPFWHVFGYALGALTARLGTKSAMLCTEAVEDVIDSHYEEQKLQLEEMGTEGELFQSIKKFQQEEVEHKEIASSYTSNLMLGDRLLLNSTKIICRLAIFISKRF